MKAQYAKLLGLCLGAALVLHGSGALALTDAHKATATGAVQGDCSACHIPHKAAGAERLFPTAATFNNAYGFIGSMCAGYCHNGTVGRANALGTVFVNPGATDATPGAHGMLRNSTTNAPANTVVGPDSLPYVSGTAYADAQATANMFECTTCHDPHKNTVSDTSEALLRLDIDALCTACHTNRGAGNTTWAGGYGDGNTGGTHPVGTDVTGDSDTATPDSDILIGMGATPNVFTAAYGASGSHNLGGHLSDGTGGVGCVTCHAVHGVQADIGGTADQPPTSDYGPYEDLLVIDQGIQGTAEPNVSNNGNGASNYLCEGCHAYNSLAANNWNPGSSAYSHPANGQVATMDMGTITGVAPATTWPYGTGALAPLYDLAVICESCHKPHAAAANSHILRQDETVICNTCHTSAPAQHHPANVAMGTMADTDIDGGVVGTLECTDCHKGSGAHNWTDAGAVGLNPLWEPFDNARGAGDVIGQTAANISKECIDCHMAEDNTAPTAQTSYNGRSSADFENSGHATHYMGDTSLSFAGQLSTGAFNATTTAWPSTGYSRFATVATSGTRAIVCESCHELEPAKNINAGNVNALLLHDSSEMLIEDQSWFCTGCHGVAPGGGGTHPLTGQSVTAAVDAGLAATLSTAVTRYANNPAAPGNAEYAGGTGGNRVNCDSCHQVHNAYSETGSFVLEYMDEAGTTTWDGSTLDTVTVSGVSLPLHRNVTSKGMPHDSLCVQCHLY